MLNIFICNFIYLYSPFHCRTVFSKKKLTISEINVIKYFYYTIPYSQWAINILYLLEALDSFAAFKCLTVAAKKARTINDLHEIGISNNHMLSELWYFTSVHSLAPAYLSKPSIKYPI